MSSALSITPRSTPTLRQGLLFDACGLTRNSPPAVPFDDSETDDIVLSRQRMKPQTPADTTPIAPASTSMRPHPTTTTPADVSPHHPPRPPKRIGHGKLATPKLGWRPGDPFDLAARPTTGGFEWNRMLASACVTAACGLLAVWLLHTIFA